MSDKERFYRSWQAGDQGPTGTTFAFTEKYAGMSLFGEI
jgi:hypothetical protein